MIKTNQLGPDKESEEQRNIAVFKEEAFERLAELESALLELEETPDNTGLVDCAFRAMHTIKGSGGMFGFDEIVEFTHNIETVFDKVRDGSIPITNELIALTLSAHDQIGKLLKHINNPLPEDIEKRKEITRAFLEYLPIIKSQETVEKGSDFNRLKNLSKNLSVYRIRFKPNADLFATGSNPLLLLNELKGLGECQAICQVDQIVSLETLDPEKCYVWWDIILSTREQKNEIQDVFIFVEDNCEIRIDLLETDVGPDSDDNNKKLGEILVERGDIGISQLEKVLANKTLLGEQLENEGLVRHNQIESALIEQRIVKQIKEQRKKVESVTSIRVSSQKLDKLVDLVGELVTAQASLSQIAAKKADSDIVSIAEEIERLTSELRDSTMSARMLTFGSTFNKFKRLVRDLSSELNKEIVLITEGEETELDKNVIEQLNDPLVHLLRNSADHGIEDPDKRIAVGKTRQGTIKLVACYSGAQVIIKIEDDGAGIDLARVRAKAIAKGMITKEAKLSDKECHFLIFEPGFSTAETVTNVSGRGVGMDVVKKAIDNLRGSIDIESTLGKGTIISIKLPLTLAIIDGLLVKVGFEFYVIPLAFVEECIELTEMDVKNAHDRHLVNVRNQIVPYVRLRDQFQSGGLKPPIEQVVITEIEGQRIGFVVDSVIGQYQTVIKNLSKLYRNVDTISGATIMADGTVALIIDINKHLQHVEKDYRERYSKSINSK